MHVKALLSGMRPQSQRPSWRWMWERHILKCCSVKKGRQWSLKQTSNEVRPSLCDEVLASFPGSSPAFCRILYKKLGELGTRLRRSTIKVCAQALLAVLPHFVELVGMTLKFVPCQINCCLSFNWHLLYPPVGAPTKLKESFKVDIVLDGLKEYVSYVSMFISSLCSWHGMHVCPKSWDFGHNG